MHFLSPIYLLFLIPVAALVALYVIVQFRRKAYVARFSNVELLGSVAPRRPGWRRHLTFALLLVGLIVLSIGVAKPSVAVRVPSQRATVILAIDVSPSMAADDVKPSRLIVALRAAKTFAGLLPSKINLGLVDFGGTANLLVSPTLNRGTVTTAIGKLTKPIESTAIGEAIFTSLQAIQVFGSQTKANGEKPPPARIVLLSDGQTTVGRSNASAVAAAKKAKVSVSTIAFGTAFGQVPIPGHGVQAVPDDPDALRTIAQGTGGSFFNAHDEPQLRAAYKNIGSQIGYTTKQRDISWRFMLGGLLFLLAAGGAAMLWSGRLV